MYARKKTDTTSSRYFTYLIMYEINNNDDYDNNYGRVLLRSNALWSL